MAEENQESEPREEAEPDYDSMSVEQLESLMDGTEPPAGEVDTTEETVVTDEQGTTPESDTEPPVTEPAVEDSEPQAEADGDSEPEPEPLDVDALLKEQIEIERKKAEAEFALKFEKQRAHTGRLATEIDLLKRQLGTRPAVSPAEPGEYVDEPVQRDDRVELLQRKLEALETRQRQESVDQAIAGAIQGFSGLMGEVSQEEVKPAAEKYVGDWQQALDSTDPGTAGALAKAVLTRIAADVEETRFLAKKQVAEERRAAMTDNLTKQKKDATISGAGAAAPPKPRAKSYDEMTIEELEAELEKEARR